VSAQTEQLFSSYAAHLGTLRSTLLANTLRTWVFVRDVDSYYGGMVAARRGLFQREGLTPETHYVVSTGIEGGSADPGSLVALDALSVQGLDPEQVRYIDRLDHLNRTDEYGVTFERAVRLQHADRNHLYVAGTASIDAAGRVLHEGDVESQVERTIENISALLEEGRATLDDVAAMIVYLRDAADADRVRTLLERIGPTLPYVGVRAPVCRPTWLVEIEALAITPDGDARWPVF
jgi:enamine deaminase RidA (YjgF/YER057c/UK114 family)